MTSTLNLFLPIKQLANRRVEVTTELTSASVSMPQLDAPVTQLNGSMRIRQSLPDWAELKGQWLGGPLNISVRPNPDNTTNGSELVASGRALVEQLTASLRVPDALRMSGATGWRLATTLGPGNQNIAKPTRQVRLDVDMDQVTVELPEPLGKAAQEQRPLRLDLEVGERSMLVRSSWGDIRSLLRAHRPDAKWMLERGTVRADGVAASLPDHRGLRVEGDIERLVIDDWLALRGRATSSKLLSDYLQAASVRVGSLELYGYRWPDVRGILQMTDAGWRVDVDSPNVVGQVVIPEQLTGAQPLTAQLERLVLSEQQRPGESGSRDPRKIPGVLIHIGTLQVANRTLGTLDLKMSRVAQGIQIDNATVVSDSLRASLRGHWLDTQDGQRSALHAQVNSSDVAATLRSLGYTAFMEGEQGEIRADLSWTGGPSADFISRASGALTVSAQAGQLLNLQPGAGRVLGLFSIAALPRRMALDFSDLTEKGLSFDSVHGDFELRDGNAYTSNLLLRGPAAEIGVAGRTGLRTRDYDQTAVVTGNLGASLPVAGALAGGPAIGAALLLFSQVFKEPLKGITRGYYRITGPWDNPMVERVDASDAKQAKAERVTK
jgi:uncharacterized protein YhdP